MNDTVNSIRWGSSTSRGSAVLICVCALLPRTTWAAFPLVRHVASGGAQVQLNGRQQQSATSHTTDDMDLSMSFVAESSLGPGVPTHLKMEGQSTVSLTDTKLRGVVQLEVEYLVNQGSPGGGSSGALSSTVEFTMALGEVPLHITIDKALNSPFQGAISLVIDNVTTGTTIYQDDGSFERIDAAFEGSAGDTIRIYTGMMLYGTVLAGTTQRSSGLEVVFEVTIVDCNSNGVSDPLDVLSGISTDCNNNGVLDECEFDCNGNGLGDVCDILAGRSTDCNDDSIPDECDLSIGEASDCNANGIPDSCDVQSGLLADLNGNGFPDACEFDTLYVDAAAPPGGNGSGWLMAYSDVQAALQHAANSAGIVKTIKVADGNYRPRRRLDPPESRSATFSLPSGVEIFGGFAGISNPSAARDPLVYTSTLDGDLAGDDTEDFGNRGDNAYHVTYALDTTGLTLDGFTVRGGYADGPISPDDSGGGMLILDMSLTVRNCVFQDNHAGRIDPSSPSGTYGGGGAVARYIIVPYPNVDPLRFESCRFAKNQAPGGGAVATEYYPADFVDCLFEENRATSGGAFSGLATDGPISFMHCTFRENLAEEDGGAVELHLSEPGAVLLQDSSFIGNSAGFAGGGVLVWDATTLMDNCTFQNNQAPFGGGALFFSHATIANCLFEDNNAEERGAGLFTSQMGTAVVERSTFVGNDCGGDGGGQYGGGPLVILDSVYENNWADIGGGLSTLSPQLHIARTVFDSNRADQGGAIADRSYGNPPLIERSTLVRNIATYGGALYWGESENGLILRNCLLAQNGANAYGGAFAGGGATLEMSGCTVANNVAGDLAGGFLLAADTVVDNSIFWGNFVDTYPERRTDEFAQIEGMHFADIEYSTVQGWSGDFGGEGNLGDDPGFVNPISPTSGGSEIGNYRVQPDSPAIDAGDPGSAPEAGESDLDGHARVLCGRVDMGVYEFGIGDVNCDRVVDLSDFASWPGCAEAELLPAECVALDFNNDGRVDLIDFAAIQRLDWH